MGGAGGTGGAAKATPGPKKTKQAKTNCVVCRATTNKIASNREGAVQCGVCEGWWHPKCAQLSAEAFDMIAKWVEQFPGNQSPWKCQSCENSSAKLLNMVTLLSSKVDENKKALNDQAGRLNRVEDKSSQQDKLQECQGREIKELREQLAKLADMGGPGVIKEMDERSLKENNLVFHRVREAGGVEARMRIDEDKVSIQQLLQEMELNIGVEENTKFARRLGPRPGELDAEERSDPRPLLVGFTHRHHTELIVANSWRLAESDNMAVRAVSVARDLTLRQRAGEKELYKEAARKNLTRSQEQIDGNMAFKVVGKRGAKREILAPLRRGEEINEGGEVGWVREAEGGPAGGRRTARGGGPSAATYPNCLALGRKGGGGMMGPNLGTAQDQRQSQNWNAGGSIGGRGSGGEWRTAGRNGSFRPRAISRSPPAKEPPMKKVDSRNSPQTAHKGSPLSRPVLEGRNIFVTLDEEENGTEEPVDDAEEVV